MTVNREIERWQVRVMEEGRATAVGPMTHPNTIEMVQGSDYDALADLLERERKSPGEVIRAEEFAAGLNKGRAKALAEVREALEGEEAVHILDSALFDFPDVHGGKITNCLRLLREFLSNALEDAEEEQ